MTVPTSPERVSQRHVAWVRERLSQRDRCVIETLRAVRIATGRQLDPLCFGDLSGKSQSVVRGRVLHRLVRWRVLRTLDRRIGGPAAGSAAAVYLLDSAGLAALRPAGAAILRGDATPGPRFVDHMLAVTNVYADLVRRVPAATEAFVTEPASWVPVGLGGVLKPDAYLVLAAASVRDHWWLEVDRATESLSTVRRKLTDYLAFHDQGHSTGGVIPRVVISVPNDRRRTAIERLIAQLPEPATDMFMVAIDRHTALALLSRLRE